MSRVVPGIFVRYLPLMIHIATVHWRSDAWIDPQLRYLQHNIDEPFQIYAWLDEGMEQHAAKFHYSTDVLVRQHEYKLTILGDLMIRTAADDDLLIFIDGDAFPVQPIMPFLHSKLERYPLVAVRRDENNGDSQPHPSFCVMRASFWRELPGDWRRGATWLNPQGKEVTDVGGNMRQLLIDRGVDWHPMLRSNKVNPHPLNFGIYEDLIYHHGGGFRNTAGGRLWRAAMEDELRGRPMARVAERLPTAGPLGRVRKMIHPVRRYRRSLAEEIGKVNEQVFDLILRDEDFYLQLIHPERGGELTEIVAPTTLAEAKQLAKAST